jgi:hypothetical protein
VPPSHDAPPALRRREGGGARLHLSFGCPGGIERRWRHQGEVAGGEEEARCNTRSTFETFRYNTCNIRLEIDETLETCISNTWKKHLKAIEKHTQHPYKIIATYV